MNFLLKFHGELRWLVVLVAAIALVRFGSGLVRKAELARLDRILMAAFTGLLDLNVLLGLTLLFGLGGGLPGYRLEHATTMLLAVVVAHLSAIGRATDDAPRRFRKCLVAVVVAVALVALGVIRLRGGWVF